MEISITKNSDNKVIKFSVDGGTEKTLIEPMFENEFFAKAKFRDVVQLEPNKYFFFNGGGSGSGSSQLLTLDNFIQVKDDFYEFKFANQLQCEVDLSLQDLLEYFAKSNIFIIEHLINKRNNLLFDRTNFKLVIWGGDSREKWKDRKIGKFEITIVDLFNLPNDTWYRLGEYQYETDSWFYSFWIKYDVITATYKIKGYHYKTSDTATTQNYENTFNAVKGVKLEVI